MLISNVKIIGNVENCSSIKIKNGKIIEVIPAACKTNQISENDSIHFENAIAFPGLINSHDHLEFNLFSKLGNKIYEDYIEWGNDIHFKNKEIIDQVTGIDYNLRFKLGLYKNLICGVTTVINHGSSQIPSFKYLPDVFTKYNYLYSIKLEKKWKLKLNIVFNGLPFVIHIGEGTNPEAFNEIDEILKWNIFRKKIIGVHAIALAEKQSRKFKAIVWCPDSNIYLYNRTADIRSIKNNTAVLFGTDSSVSANWNIWEHIRIARQFNYLDDLELFESLTKTPATVWKLNSKGFINKRMNADVIVAKNIYEKPIESFYALNPKDILLVVKSGNILLFDEKLEINNLNLNKKDFDKIRINSTYKFVTKGIINLFNEVKEKIPGFTFPFTID